MHSKFFTHTSIEMPHENNVQRFLENFPEEEFWRFFIERSRFDLRPTIYNLLYSKLLNIPSESATAAPMMEFIDTVNGVTVRSLYEMVNDVPDLEKWLGQYGQNEIFRDIINRQIGWVGFEDNEPGYLSHITQGLAKVLTSVIEKETLSLDFIKTLHKICTDKVENMVEQTPGEFRNRPALWVLTDEDNTKAGLIESIDYLKHVEKEYGQTHFLFSNTEEIEMLGSLEQETQDLANLVWANKDKPGVYFYAGGHSKDNIEEFLALVGEAQIQELEAQLKPAKTKEEKLTAIFTFLKHAVLFHPFQDGVGRTYSMLLTQYLLMRENLLPVLLINSNIIPGYSVQELVKEYLRAEEEMEHILTDRKYITSEEFAKPNVDTALLNTLMPGANDIFEECLKVYEAARQDCLRKLIGSAPAASA